MTSSGSVLTRGRRPPFERPSRLDAAILAVSAASSILFAIVRPHVADLYASMAREYAARHGVGLGYWFSWYGGTVPGHYSVAEPFVAVALGSALLGCLSAIALIALTYVLLRDAPHRTAGLAAAAVAIICNLWSGRVPFLFGMVGLLVALVAVRGRRPVLAVVVAVIIPLITPTCAAFLALAMVGVAVFDGSRRTLVVAGAQGLVFGSPGPEGYQPADILLGLLVLALLLVPDLPRWARSSIALSFPVVVGLAVIPNALGANYNRAIYFCLPVLVAALARNRKAVAALGVLLALVLGGSRTVRDLIVAAAPMSSIDYYAGLRHELRALPDLAAERVEVVFDGTHTSGYAILGYAQNARGYETQSDHAFADVLSSNTLDADRFRRWLDTNAVGYVALPHSTLYRGPEYKLVADHRPGYLHPIWHDADMTLFRVERPTPIVAAPGKAVDASQTSLTVSVPAGSSTPVTIRVRWSRFLTVDGGGRAARVEAGRGGFTRLYAPHGCRCVLEARF